MAQRIKLEEAMKNIQYVTNDLELKNAVAKKALMIISTDIKLYEKLLQKYPKEKNVKRGRTLGKIIAGLGIAVDVVSFGVFSFIGTPMIITGTALAAIGLLGDDYKDYSIVLNHNEMQVMLFKENGDPRLDEKDMKKLRGN